MPIEDARAWPTLHYRILADYRGVQDSTSASTGSTPVIPDSKSMPARDAQAPSEAMPELVTTLAGRKDGGAKEHATGATTSEDIPEGDEPVGLMSVADVIAMALTAGATGAMQHAAGVAPPPPGDAAGSSAATAAPAPTTFYTAASSAATEALGEAQLATGVYQEPESDTDEETGAGSDGDAADDEKADGDLDGNPLFPAHHYSGFAAWLAQPMLAVGVYNGLVGAATPQTSAFALSPAVWPTAEDDESEASDDESD